MTTRKEVVEKRRNLFQMAERKHAFRKGDKRVATPRLCVVCSRPLTSLVMREMKYVTSHTHYHVHFNGMFTVDVCEDVHSCYRTLQQKGELT
jgi:hypothetical protein